MCDTIVATGSATEDGITLFGKNSDREPNEAQYICRIPAAEYPNGRDVQCTYISIPQVRKTHAVILSRPFWMWGAEMGANEFGLVIGNEAVFTKVPYSKTSGLTGMDLIRLALERGETARQALTIITELIATHGQGGNCGYHHKMFYHNSFILADPDETWLLETAGKHWAAKKITEIYAISNRITIQDKWDLASDELVSFAIQKKWSKTEADFSFARCYSDFLYTSFSSSKYRQERAMHLLHSKSGKIGIADMAEILRDHGEEKDKSFRPDKGLIQSNICNHASFGPVRVSQTTGSMISHLTKDNPTHFVTGTAAPCTSIYKPVWIDTQLPVEYKKPSKYYDDTFLFWKHELLHRKLLHDFYPLISGYREERDQLEEKFFKNALIASQKDISIRDQYVVDCFKLSQEKESQWILRLQNKNIVKKCGLLYSVAWKKHNQSAQVPV